MSAISVVGQGTPSSPPMRPITRMKCETLSGARFEGAVPQRKGRSAAVAISSREAMRGLLADPRQVLMLQSRQFHNELLNERDLSHAFKAAPADSSRSR